MTLGTIVGGKKLVINEAYLHRGGGIKEIYRILDQDLANVSDGGEVHLIRPKDTRLNPVFADVLSYVCAKAIEGDYIIKPTNDYDANKIRAILGGNIVGSLQQGYKFKRRNNN